MPPLSSVSNMQCSLNVSSFKLRRSRYFKRRSLTVVNHVFPFHRITKDHIRDFYHNNGLWNNGFKNCFSSQRPHTHAEPLFNIMKHTGNCLIIILGSSKRKGTLRKTTERRYIFRHPFMTCSPTSFYETDSTLGFTFILLFYYAIM